MRNRNSYLMLMFLKLKTSKEKQNNINVTKLGIDMLILFESSYNQKKKSLIYCVGILIFVDNTLT